MKCKGIIIKLVAVLTVVLSIGVTAYGHCMRDYRANFGNSGVCQNTCQYNCRYQDCVNGSVCQYNNIYSRQYLGHHRGHNTNYSYNSYNHHNGHYYGY